MSTSNINNAIDELQSLVQVLVVSPKEKSKKHSQETLFSLQDVSLWVGPQKVIVDKLGLAQEKDPKLPSPGLSLAPGFPPEPDCSQESDEEKLEMKSTQWSAQLMLKARKLSQLWAQSWLEGEYLETACKEGLLTQEQYDHIDRDSNQLLRALFLTAMEEPDSYWISLPGITDIINDFKDINRDGMSVEENISDNKAILLELSRVLQARNLPKEKQIKYAKLRNILSRVILPSHAGWDLIRFNMLIAGQVFVKKGEDKYERLIEPIVSTYDICVNYSFSEISWDGKLGCIEIETSKPGGKSPRPGYYRTSAAYPPRPTPYDSTTTPKRVFCWAMAKDEYTFQPTNQKDSFPFYPPKDDNEYVSNYVDFISPPYPYMPVSSC